MRTEPSTTQVMEEQGIPTELHRPGKLTVLIVFVAFLLLLGALFVVGYIPREHQREEIQADAAERASAVPTVGITKVREMIGSKDIVLPADVRPNQQTAIYPRATGYLSKLYVDINDHVEAGQLLAEISTPEIDAQLAQSKANLEQAKANYAKAQTDLDLAAKTLDRYEHLPPGAASAQDIDQRRSAHAAAASFLALAKASIGVAEADVQRLTVLQSFEKVTAPFAGTITARNYDVGALLSASNTAAGRELFVLTQSDTLLVCVDVPQVYASQIVTGEPATLEVRNYPNRQFKGTVYRASGAINGTTRTMLFELRFLNPDGMLYAGMYGQVRLGISNQKPVLVIPTSAMLFTANGTQVALVQDGKVHFQSIRVGRDFGTEMEVLAGLTADAAVIANPAGRISEGLRVEPRILSQQGQKAAGTEPPTTRSLAQREQAEAKER